MLHFQLLSREHDRDGFFCGEPALDAYLRRQAGQDAKRGFATAIVCTDTEEPRRVVGYYTLSMSAIPLDRLEAQATRSMPRYDVIPAILLGRLALDKCRQGQGIGRFLVLDALRRSFVNELA